MFAPRVAGSGFLGRRRCRSSLAGSCGSKSTIALNSPLIGVNRFRCRSRSIGRYIARTGVPRQNG
jgi:hypothetical protein